MNVLICNIGLKSDLIFLPYLWGRVKAYCEFNDDRDFSKANFIQPIYDGNIAPTNDVAIKEIMDRYDLKDVDLILFSNYVWNWQTHLAMAKYAKSVNPNIVIIGGGPSSLYKPGQDTHLFYDFDYVSSGESEEVCADVLYNMINGISLENIEGLVDPRFPKDVRAKRVELSSLVSPYLAYKEDFIKWSKDISSKGDQVGLVWEYNRGCPYKCSFCDWGMTTQSKVKSFNLRQAKEEIEFVCSELKPIFIFHMDANGGIMKTDVEVFREFANQKKKNGYPKLIYWSPAKNNKKYVNEIIQILFEAELATIHQIGFQNFDEDVLKNVDRDNISIETMSEVMNDTYLAGIPIGVALITGMPGDTPKKWMETINTALKMNFQEYRLHDFLLLPGAPAASPEYLKKHKITTMTRMFSNSEYGVKDNTEANFEAVYPISSYSFTPEDYAEIQLINATVFALNALNLTRFVERFCYYYHDIEYKDFYNALYKKPFFKKILNEAKVGIGKWMKGENDIKFMPWKNHIVSFDLYIWLRCIEEDKEFFKEVYEMLVNDFGLDEDICFELIKYQKRTIIAHWKEEDITIKYDLHDAIKRLKHMKPNEKLKDRSIKKQDIVLSTNSGLGVETLEEFLNHRIDHSNGRGDISFYKEIAL